MPKTITKKNIVDNIHGLLAYSRQETASLIETFLDIFRDALKEDGEILISGFGKFKVRQTKKRKGRNPNTGKDIILPPRKVLTFKSSPKLKEKLNNNKGIYNKDKI